MFMITNFIEPYMEKLILNHLIEKNCPCDKKKLQWPFGQLPFQTNFRKWLFGTLFLDSRFQNHPDSLIFQKYQSLPNQSFKHNSAHMPSLNLTPNKFFLNLGFVCSSLTITTQKHLHSLDSLFYLFYHR